MIITLGDLIWSPQSTSISISLNRRRYYTDYVGTAPLSAMYNKYCGLNFGKETTIVKSMQKQESNFQMFHRSVVRYLSRLGNGSVASLSVGSGSSNWRGEIDANSTAQNFADLVNKEDRVSKSAVEFSPTFILEGSTSNVAVHNEFWLSQL